MTPPMTHDDLLDLLITAAVAAPATLAYAGRLDAASALWIALLGLGAGLATTALVRRRDRQECLTE